MPRPVVHLPGAGVGEVGAEGRPQGAEVLVGAGRGQVL
jgi:hypothetical protein